MQRFCFELASNIKDGKKIDFFKLYNFICDSNPHSVVEWIKNNRDSKFTNQLFSFILRVYHLQKKQQEQSIGKNENFIPKPTTFEEYTSPERGTLLLSNHYRIGNDVKEIGEINLEDYKNFETVLQKLIPNTSMVLGIEDQTTDAFVIRGHAIIAYMEDDPSTIAVFDPNDGMERKFSSVKEAAQFIMRQSNLIFEKPWWLELKDKNLAGSVFIKLLEGFALGIIMATNQKKFEHSEEEKRTKNLGPKVKIWYWRVEPTDVNKLEKESKQQTTINLFNQDQKKSDPTSQAHSQTTHKKYKTF